LKPVNLFLAASQDLPTHSGARIRGNQQPVQ
jgi:hypothetical protein